MRHLARARNPYSLSWLWIPGSRGACHRAAPCADPLARPGMTPFVPGIHALKPAGRGNAALGKTYPEAIIEHRLGREDSGEEGQESRQESREEGDAEEEGGKEIQDGQEGRQEIIGEEISEKVGQKSRQESRQENRQKQKEGQEVEAL